MSAEALLKERDNDGGCISPPAPIIRSCSYPIETGITGPKPVLVYVAVYSRVYPPIYYMRRTIDIYLTLAVNLALMYLCP